MYLLRWTSGECSNRLYLRACATAPRRDHKNGQTAAHSANSIITQALALLRSGLPRPYRKDGSTILHVKRVCYRYRGSDLAYLEALLESSETCATVHEQGLTGNERGCVAGKKRDRGSDLTRMSEPAHRHPAQIPGLAFAALRIV